MFDNNLEVKREGHELNLQIEDEYIYKCFDSRDLMKLELEELKFLSNF